MFTIEHSEFLNNFYERTKFFADCIYEQVVVAIKNDSNNYFSHFFTKKEIAMLIILHKKLFQNISSFTLLFEKGFICPALNSLRASIEAVRLFRAFFIDDTFRKSYISNPNIELTVPDYAFMQKHVCKVLETRELELKKLNIIPLFSPTAYNHELTKGSPMSNIHCELSKWSHLLNANLLLSQYLTSGKIRLDLEDDFDDYMQQYLKKYIETMYHILSFHLDLFYSSVFNIELCDYANEMSELYLEYITLFYK